MCATRVTGPDLTLREELLSVQSRGWTRIGDGFPDQMLVEERPLDHLQLDVNYSHPNEISLACPRALLLIPLFQWLRDWRRDSHVLVQDVFPYEHTIYQ